MQRFGEFTSLWTKSSVALLLAMALVSCGAKDESGGKQKTEDVDKSAALACGESSHDASVDEIRLKDLNTMVKTTTDVFGPGSDRDINDGTVSIFEKYKNTFPNFEGTDYADTVADKLSSEQKAVAVVMAQAIIARNVALQASRKGEEDPFYKCNTEQSAAAMLNRAIPYYSFCANEDDSIVTDFAKLCADDHQAAISALASSVAFMMRN